MKVLNIAEKPSVAKAISHILSTSCRSVPSVYKFCPNITFKYVYAGNDADFVFTSVLGHVFTTDFVNKQRWEEIDPELLFEEKLVSFVKDDFLKLKENIEKNVAQASVLIIWTDCDREGEHIASQIARIALGVKNIVIKRARFFGINKREIDDAINNLAEINKLEADAVDARMELDLRIGSSFTRLQTLSLKREVALDVSVVSYGSCQIPTLGFVVERAKLIEDFVKEPFWTLNAVVERKQVENTFLWERSNVFDKNCVVHFFNAIQKTPAKVVLNEEKPREKMRPLPLRTVDFQKVCTSYFKMSAHKLMERAESLYNRGFISYPRTETDSFGKNFKFAPILAELEKDTKVEEYASALASKFAAPREGKNNDMAHLPIYPLKSGNGLVGEDARIFEFIARRFLGCLSENAKAFETKIVLRIGDETFKLTGLKITERNYLGVYFYDKWENKLISDFSLGEIITGYALNVVEGATTPPEYLTEAELITLMDKNGIGTDATIHEHIQKIQTRSYAKKERAKIMPLSLGKALIEGYDVFGLEFSKPKLRSELEENLKRIERGEITGKEVVKQQIAVYRGIYRVMKGRINEFVRVFKDVKPVPPPSHAEPEDDADEGSFTRVPERRERKSDTRRGAAPQRDNNTGPRSKPRAKPDNPGPSTKKVEKKPRPGKENIDREIDSLIQTVRKNSAVKLRCKCKQEAKACTVAKKNENEGRVFYGCGMFPRKCDMFVWEEDVDSYNAEPYEDEPTGVTCECGYETKSLVAHSGTNKGKAYFKCKKAYKPCNFFQWKD